MSSIVLIAPFEELARVAQDTCRKLNENIPIRTATMDNAVQTAREAIGQGAEVIISRGSVAWKIEQARLPVPLIHIPITGYDLLRAFLQARKVGNKIGMADTPEVLAGVESLESMFKEKIETYPVHSPKDAERAIQALMHKGIDVLIGKMVYVRMLADSPIRTVVLSSGQESIIQAINEAKKVVEVRRAEVAQTEQVRAILDFISDGVLAVDDKGLINVCNPAAEKLLKVAAGQVKGKPVDDLFAHLQVTDTLRSGEEKLNQITEHHGVKMINHQVPIRYGEEVLGVLCTFQELSKLQQQEQEIRTKLAHKGHVTKYTLKDMAGKSKIFQQTVDKARKFASVDSTILLTGETGVGKEVLAHLIHNSSRRSQGPFVAVNCAAIPEHLLESELFGYVEGAFTGAKRGGKAGLFELAHRGTIFLDEIGELPEALQVRLLRVLQEREVMRLGAERLIPVDVRVIAASNRDLENMVRQETFRADLFYRINVLRIDIPSLRERKEDIPLLCEHIIQELKQEIDRDIQGFADDAMDLLQRYAWPGNIRELRNFIERAMILSPGSTIRLETVLEAGGHAFRSLAEKENRRAQPIQKSSSTPPEQARPAQQSENLSSYERHHILKVLEQVDGNQTKAAKILGIGRTTLWRKLKEMKEQEMKEQ